MKKSTLHIANLRRFAIYGVDFFRMRRLESHSESPAMARGTKNPLVLSQYEILRPPVGGLRMTEELERRGSG